MGFVQEPAAMSPSPKPATTEEVQQSLRSLGLNLDAGAVERLKRVGNEKVLGSLIDLGAYITEQATQPPGPTGAGDLVKPAPAGPYMDSGIAPRYSE
jgi:hypothetical protein